MRVARDEPAQAIARLKSHPDGLSAREAASRLARSGPNEVEHEKPLPLWLHWWHGYQNPFNLLLTVLAMLLSTLIRFVQEGRSHRAAESLKAMVGHTATVIRRAPGTKTADTRAAPKRLEIPIRKLAPGDMVVLAASDMIPADCRVLTASLVAT